MDRCPRGSEWRKWDLHVHVPATNLNNQYAALPGGQPDWQRYCSLLEASDVAVFGITDYFGLDRYFEFIEHHRRLCPQSRKVFLPNMELRLNEVVNKAGEEVNIHLLFREGLDKATADRFMRELQTELHTAEDRPRSCSDLKITKDFESATVTRKSIVKAIEATFGKRHDRQENVLVVTSCKGDGIRTQRGSSRKENLTDEIDKLSDGFFGRSSSVTHFLDTSRLEDPTDSIKPKPVFGGCDAHSFADLDATLGLHVPVGPTQSEITWIKADPTFEGLRQTFIEPQGRVRIQPTTPDAKEPYKYISRVTFADGATFPGEVVFNSNLCSIIGTRSSGKSALLAYISYAVDPGYTVDQQLAAGVVHRMEDAGPAAGRSWSEMGNGVCTVEWGNSSATTGRVIYIPQNSLYSISERPAEITAKIQPALYREDPDFEAAHRRMIADVAAANETIAIAAHEWFRLASEVTVAQQGLRNLGDRAAITSVREGLSAEIERVREASSLTPEETEKYQGVMATLAVNAIRVETIETEFRDLAPYVTIDENGRRSATEIIGARVVTTPAASAVPPALGEILTRLVEEVGTPLTNRIRQAVLNYRATLDVEHEALESASATLRTDNVDLIEKNEANAELDLLVRRRQTQVETVSAIDVMQAQIDVPRQEQLVQAKSIKNQLGLREAAIQQLLARFAEGEHLIDELHLGVEAAVDVDDLSTVSQDLNRRDRSAFLDEERMLRLGVIGMDPSAFLTALYSGEQKIRQGRTAAEIAVSALRVTPDVRFYAELEGDRIGGFQRSSMTPGKQALFALSLILNESDDPWPLLIDQPEDDLDSWSIYEQIVPYLVKRKTNRQIIMVTHDANLVVGADSEQVIIANRHGVDRPNLLGRTFDYLSGSLEHSSPHHAHNEVLQTCGIREHACQILDGGEDAFRKRAEKYQI